ncbi:MAG: branched-chain amino acid ABC transporter permease [Castellaniella sp.]
MFLVVLPYAVPASLAVDILIYAIAALAFSLMLGHAGMLSFGQSAFLAIGAYITGFLLKHYELSAIPLLLLAAVGGAMSAMLVAFLTARLKDVYFILMTLAFAQLVYFVAMSWRSVTGGPSGLTGFERPVLSLGFMEISLGSNNLYIFSACVMLVIFGMFYALVLSPVGLALRGMKDNAERLQAVGYPVARYRIFVFTLSGAMTGVAGALSAFQWLLVPVSKASMNESANIVFMSILGGVNAPLGPVVGATVYIWLSDIVSSYWARWPLLFGAFIIFIVFFMRGGIAQGVAALPRLFARR